MCNPTSSVTLFWSAAAYTPFNTCSRAVSVECPRRTFHSGSDTYKMGVMVYRCLHGQAPRYLADHLITSSDIPSRLRLRSANRHQLIVHRCRLNTYGRRAFSTADPTVWNSLPDELRDPACGSDSFKQFLKTILFSLYQCDQRIRGFFKNVMRYINPRFTYLLTYLLT